MNQWFRMYSEFAKDPKVQSMDETLQRRFIMFLCLQCSGEYERLTDDELAFALRISSDELAKSKDVFTQKGFIDENGKISNWNKRQYKSDNSTERVRKHRETFQKRDETFQKRPQIQITDTDTDKNPDRASAKPEPVVEPDGFADIRKAYPKRAGSQRWQDALTAYRARLKEGVTPDEILAGVERYAAFVRADGKEGTPYVQQAATFIGKNRGYTEPWKPPAKVVNLSPVERVRLAAERAKNGTANEQGDGSLGDSLGDLREPVSTGIRRLAALPVGFSDCEPEGL